MRILMCGSRTWTDVLTISTVIRGLEMTRWGTPTLIHGCAPGADSIAGELALGRGWIVGEFPADWDTHGKAAGPLRNQQMLDEGKPDEVLAFVDKPLEESRGTNDMVQRSLKAGLPVYVIRRMSSDD